MKKNILIILLTGIINIVNGQWQGDATKQYFLGKVGIGTNMPNEKLEIKDGNLYIWPGYYFKSASTYTNSMLLYTNSNASMSFNTYFDTDENGGYTFSTNQNLKMIIKGNGKVGIGTSSPNEKFEIKDGNFYLSPGYYLKSSVSYPNSLMLYTNSNARMSFHTHFDTEENGGYTFSTNQNLKMIIRGDGNVGIGMNNPYYKLDVNGTIRAKEVKVNLNIGGADFVFEPDYDLMSLNDLESYLKNNKHLPNIESAKEMENEGLNLSEFNIILLQKIEELTLYTIAQQSEIEELKKQNERIEELEKQNQEILKLIKTSE